MTTISLKIPDALLRRLTQEAVTRGVPRSVLIRESIERTLKSENRKENCLDLMGPLVGSFKGPKELSTNRRYLIEAVVNHARSHSKNTR